MRGHSRHTSVLPAHRMAERGHRDVSHATGEVLDGSRSPGRSRPWVRRVRREVCSDFFPWIRMFYLYFSSVVALCLIHGICTALITFFFLDDNFFEWSGSYSFTMLINFVDRYRLTAYGLSVGSPKADPETRGSETEGKSQKRELREAGHSSVQTGSCWGPRRGHARTSELPPSQEHPALFGEGLPWGMTSDIPAPRPQAQLPENTLGRSCSNRRTWMQARRPRPSAPNSFHGAGGWGSLGTQHTCRCLAGTTDQCGRGINRHYTVMSATTGQGRADEPGKRPSVSGRMDGWNLSQHASVSLKTFISQKTGVLHRKELECGTFTRQPHAKSRSFSAITAPARPRRTTTRLLNESFPRSLFRGDLCRHKAQRTSAGKPTRH